MWLAWTCAVLARCAPYAHATICTPCMYVHTHAHKPSMTCHHIPHTHAMPTTFPIFPPPYPPVALVVSHFCTLLSSFFGHMLILGRGGFLQHVILFSLLFFYFKKARTMGNNGVTTSPPKCSRLKPSYEFHFEELSNFSLSVEGLVQFQDINPRT